MKNPTAATDSVHCIDPTSLPSNIDDISQLVTEFGNAAARLEALLPPRTRMDVAKFLQVVECHGTEEIEKYYGLWLDLVALGRDRQARQVANTLSMLEMSAFHHVHAGIIIDLDKMVDSGELKWPLTTTFIIETHRRLYDGAPSGLLRVRLEDGSIVTGPPGQFRATERDDIVAGNHRPPRSALLRDFLDYWEQSFSRQPTTVDSLICAVLAHHRLHYIYPFLTGNGRVARLALRAALRRLGFAGSGLWSMSRAFLHGHYTAAPGDEYVFELSCANLPSQDGAAGLALDQSVRLIVWSLQVCLREMQSMLEILAPRRIVEQFSNYAKISGLPDDAARLVRTILESEAGQLLPTEVIEKLGLPADASEKLIQDLRARDVVLIGKDSGTLRLKVAHKAAEHFFPEFNV
jgi:hypothetical protein